MKIQRVPIACLSAMSAVVLMYSRRGQTIINPQVWCEDGYYIVPSFLNKGWATMIEPVQGYLISISRIISNTALTFDPSNYPFTSTLLAWLFAAAVAVYITVAPTVFKSRFWLALACFLIPSDPEVFGTPLYCFWWAGIMLILLPFWEYKPTHFGIRLVTLILCGLSSPIIVLVTPLMALRSFFLRLRIDYWLLAASVSCSVIQLWFIFNVGDNVSTPDFSWHSIDFVFKKFFGLFVLDSNYGLDKFNSFFGIVIFFLVISILYYINNLYVSLGLLYLLISTIVISIARVDVSIIDPVRAGPRYFFYPYIILTWIFIQSFSLRRVPSVIQFASAVVLIAGLCNALISGWSRNHDDAEWELHIASGVHFKNYNIPIMFDGSRNTLWSKRYSKFQCEALLSNKNIGASNLYPFTIVKRLDLDNLQTAKDKKAANGYLVEVLQKNVEGTNYSRSAPAGYRPLGSYVTGDSDTGSVTLAMQRGARLLFTSGPGGNNQRYTVDGGKQTFSGRLPVCINWCLLDFSSDLLPDEFTVELSDEGLLWGEWFAIGLPEPE